MDLGAEFGLFLKQRLPVAGLQLVFALRLAGCIMGIESLIKAAVLRPALGIDGIRIGLQRLAQAGEARQA
ncbi:hypothetical protein D3C87_1653930 [compost metagenome]